MGYADCAVVGAGPAGLAASIQLLRAGRKVITFERSVPGGLIREANLVENYPGFPNGVRGRELANLIVDQAEKTGVRVTMESILDIKRSVDRFELRSEVAKFESKTVIMASGTRPYTPSIPGCSLTIQSVNMLQEKLDGVRIIVVGGGDIAFDYALNIAGRGGKAVILMRTGKPKAIDLLVRRVKEYRMIDIRPEVSVEEIRKYHSGFMTILSDRSEIAGDQILIACGREPEDDLIPDPIPKGMWLVGDLKNGNRRQISISVGDGVKAAMEVDDYLRGVD